MARNPFVIISMLLLTSCTDIDFNSEKWKNWEEKESNMHMRWDMVDDLIANHLHKGMNENEVETLIGKGVETNLENERVARYMLGPCRSGIDYGTLEVRFRQSKLTSVEKRCN